MKGTLSIYVDEYHMNFINQSKEESWPFHTFVNINEKYFFNEPPKTVSLLQGCQYLL
jgi:hypothetical protein